MAERATKRTIGDAAPRSWRGTLIACAILAVVLAGCGGGSDTVSTVTPEVPTATPQPTPSLKLGQVVFAQVLDADGAPEDPASEIPRSATSIYAAVEVSNVVAGSSFTAIWTMDGTVIPELESQATLETSASSGFVSFHLTWEGAALWPVGVLGVTISSNSGESVTGAVQIVST